jgi:hypothetical protein
MKKGNFAQKIAFSSQEEKTRENPDETDKKINVAKTYARK